MTTERDELAQIIADNSTVIHDSHYGDVTASTLTPDEMADEILAAGYRKPQQVTTVAELDALPVGSVVLHNGRAFQHYRSAYPAPFDEYQKWKCGDGGFVRSTKDGSSILPATVLHVGGAE